MENPGLGCVSNDSESLEQTPREADTAAGLKSQSRSEYITKSQSGQKQNRAI